MNKLYEILFIEDDIYYINFYANGIECPAIKLKLNKDVFNKWKINKIER